MEYLNIFEKLKLLFSLISNNYLFIVLLVLFVILFIVNKIKLINTKKTILLIILSFVIAFSTILFFNSENLFKTFDNISNLIFKNIYFPSLYVYIGIILIANIILLLSLFSRNMDKLYKNINIIASFGINFLCLMLINVIGSESVDILSTTSLYTNNYVVSLIELTTGLFIVWMIGLFIINFINYMVVMIDNKNFNRESVSVMDNSINMVELDVNEDSSLSCNNDQLASCFLNDNSLEIEANNIKEIDNTSSNTMDNINEVNFNDFVKKENVLLTELRHTNNDISTLMNVKPIMPSSQSIIIDNSNNAEKNEKLNKYTKEDYKLFNDILNTVRMSNHNKVITMDDALNINLLNRFSLQQYNLYKRMLKDINNKEVIL